MMPMPDNGDASTNLDQITGHSFQPGRPPLEPHACGWDGDGWPCGYSRAEHADPGGQVLDPPDGAEPDRAAAFEQARRRQRRQHPPP
jgi:hypothetical protein